MRFGIFLVLLTLPLAAQRGDRSGHDNTEPVVPESAIPPAPVLTVEQALETFEIQPGFTIEPVVAEPLVEKPVALDFDAAGRMWVCEMRGYMPDIDGKGENEPMGRIAVLEDSDGDGRAETRHTFLDQLLLPRSVCVYPDGVLFLDENRLCWVPRDGVKASGEVEVIDAGFARGGNVEHKPNGLLPNLDNWLYLAKSDKRIRRVDGEWIVDRTSFRGQWGIARDDWGRLYHNNNSTFLVADQIAPNVLTGNPAAKMKLRISQRLGSNRVWPIRVTPAVNRAYIAKANGYDQNTLDPDTHKLINCTAAAGLTVYRGTHFPDAWRNTAFITESSVNLLKAIRIQDDGGELSGEPLPGEQEFLASTDERFRPVNVYNAPDGSLYLLDMYHGIIQHKTYMTSYLREQTLSRGLDKPGLGHGRIYRIRHEASEPQEVPDLAALPPAGLVEMLRHPNAWHRETAQRLIISGKADEFAPLLRPLAADTSAPRAALHAIWSLEGLGALTPTDLEAAIRSQDAKLRAGALWAAGTLPAPALIQTVALLEGVRPSKESAPYRARMLALTATPDSMRQLAALLSKASGMRFVREAAVSGMAGHERSFLEFYRDSLGDKQLVAWLEKAAAGNHDQQKGPGLAGQELASFLRGKELFHGEAACMGCHGADGAGLDNLGPPLDGSEWVTEDAARLVKIMLHGMTGPVEVAGETYTPAAAMPGLSFNPAMTDQHIADIATYIRHEWDNRAGVVDRQQVTKTRAATSERSGRPYTAKELR